MPAARETLIQVRVKETLDGLVQESQRDYRGRLLEREGAILLHYEDRIEGEDGSVPTTVRICRGQVEIIRRGLTSGRLLYIPGEWTRCNYHTAVGMMDLRIFTDRCQFWNLADRRMRLFLSYQVELNGQKAGQRELMIELTPESENLTAD